MKIFPIVTIVFTTFCVVNAQIPESDYATFANGFPTPKKIPDGNDPQVQAWLKTIDMSKIPNLPISNGGVASQASIECKAPTVIQPDQGSWTCQKFTAEDDVEHCPEIGTWGLTYDDGPSESTPKLLSKLEEHKIQATFFVVGSQVMLCPKILKNAHDAGHIIAVHTWSHPSLTSLTNEQIVAELGWTMKAIKDVTGSTPTYLRPPYGDTDNRVRAISKALGLKTVLWNPLFDSNDWTLNADPPKTIDFVLGNFETWMQQFPKMSTGFIGLEHDLHPETVQAATTILDLAVKVPNLKIMSVPQCIGDKQPYLELKNSTNNTTKGTSSTSGSTNDSSTISAISYFSVGSIIISALFSLLNLI